MTSQISPQSSFHGLFRIGAWLLPLSLRRLWLMVLIFTATFMLARWALIGYFWTEVRAITFNDWLWVTWLGLRFDARLAITVLAPFFLMVLTPWTQPWSAFARQHPHWQQKVVRAWAMLATLILLLVALIYSIDAGNMAWFRQRMNFQTLSLARDWREAVGVIVETYPVGWWSLLFFIAGYGVYCVFLWLGDHNINGHAGIHLTPPLTPISAATPWYKSLGSKGALILIHLLLFGTLIHGAPWRAYSLRWSDTTVLTHPLVAQLALNPVQTLYDSSKYDEVSPTLASLAPYRSTLSSLYGVELASQAPYFERTMPAYRSALAPNGKPWNVVAVLMESMAYYKTGLSGNPLKPTPTIDSLANQGIFFSHAYTTYENTARAIFTLLTAMPDVEKRDFSTRNPLSAQQHLLMNEFPHDQRLYFLGGDPAFANIRGLLSNIQGLQLEDVFSHPDQLLGAWGVPDHTLMLNAHQRFDRLSREGKSFVAVIQTASHHAPNLVPEEVYAKLGLPNDVKSWPKEKFLRAGLEGLESYASLMYSDYAVKVFFEQAKNSPYFANTIFAFIGDHGIAGYPGDHAADRLKHRELRLENRHVPWVIYIPGQLKHEVHTEPVMQMDVFPTLMGLAGLSYRHTTLGRDVLAPNYHPWAFTFSPDDTPEIGLLDAHHYFLGRRNNQQQRLYTLDGEIHEVGATHPDLIKSMNEKTQAIYTLNHFLLTHNPPLPPLESRVVPSSRVD